MWSYRQPMIIDRPIQVGQLYGTEKEPNPSGGRVYSPSGIMRTLGVGNGMSKPIIIDEPSIKIVGKTTYGNERGFILDDSGISKCLTATDYKQPKQIRTTSNLRVRRLTPKECWRLMGFDDNDIDKCIAIGISNSQLYKQAGNSIVVNVLVEIFRELFKELI